jgi:Protein of unknown function with HXXEE motif
MTCAVPYATGTPPACNGVSTNSARIGARLDIIQGVVRRRIHVIFAFLIAAQAAHSTEEYVTRLYEIFAPARFVSSLVSSNLSMGFLLANVALVGFGLWCWAVPVRLDRAAAARLIWFWTLLEASNGIGHLTLAATRGGYFPGAATAPLLLLFSGWLLVLQSRRNG